MLSTWVDRASRLFGLITHHTTKSRSRKQRSTPTPHEESDRKRTSVKSSYEYPRKTRAKSEVEDNVRAHEGQANFSRARTRSADRQVKERSPSTQGRTQQEDHDRSKARRALLPLMLVAVGVLFLALAYLELPSRNSIRDPGIEWLLISTSQPLGGLQYNVMPTGPNTYSISMLGYLPPYAGKPISSVRNRPILVSLAFPELSDQTRVESCPPGDSCHDIFDSQTQEFVPAITKDIGSSGAFKFKIQSPNFAFSANGVNALVMLPRVEYDGPGSATIYVDYGLPGAQTYAWSPVAPVAGVLSGPGTWDINLHSNEIVNNQEISGINQDAQGDDSQATFLAGAFVGIGGAALIGALQEGIKSWAE